MVTRKQIRENFYSELEASTNGVVPSSNISEDEPETDEDYPAIVHNDDYRKIPINQGSAGLEELVRDSNGDAIREVSITFHEASFGLSIRDTDEQRREGIYEDVRRYFEKFEQPQWDASTIHSDISEIWVLDSNSDDDTDSTPNVRGDRLIIRLKFTRRYERDVDSIDTVTSNIDADGDGSEDEVYTTS